MESSTVEQLIRDGETARVEFKVAPPRISDLAVRLCGFANASGGTLVIGVADADHAVVGVKSASAAIDCILQAARLCKPALSLVPAEPEVITLYGRQLVIAQVAPRTGHLHQSGGVFWMRRGTHTVPLELSEIQQHLYSMGTLDWEKQPVPRATLDDLQPDLLHTYLEGRPPEIKKSGRLNDLETLLLTMGCAGAPPGEAARPTNAGLLLFGRYPQTYLPQAEIICMLFGDELGLERYRDRRILSGPLTKQIDQGEAFLKQYLPIRGRLEGFHRIDEPDYPLPALREALVNAVVHRDYSLTGEAIRIFVYPNRIEIHSPGLLLPGVRLTELRAGKTLSRPRNTIVATTLRDFPGGYMERAGTGIRFIFAQMQSLGNPPPEFTEQNQLSVTFFRRSAPTEIPVAEALIPQIPIDTPASKTAATEHDEHDQSSLGSLKQQQRLEIALQQSNTSSFITNRTYRTLLNISESTARRDLELLVEQGLLRCVGKGRSTKYVR